METISLSGGLVSDFPVPQHQLLSEWRKIFRRGLRQGWNIYKSPVDVMCEEMVGRMTGERESMIALTYAVAEVLEIAPKDVHLGTVQDEDGDPYGYVIRVSQ